MVTILFFVSLAILLVLSLLRAVDLKVARLSWLNAVCNSGDRKIAKMFGFGFSKYNRVKNITNIFIFEFIPAYSIEILVKAKDAISKKYYENGDRFRGRRVLRTDGSVSFFLERLGEEGSSSQN